MKNRVRLGLLVLLGCLLFVPSVAGAAVIADPRDVAVDLSGMDIHYLSHTFDSSTGTSFFEMEMYGNAGFADYYTIYLSEDTPDQAERGWYISSEYIGYDSAWNVDYNVGTFVDSDHFTRQVVDGEGSTVTVRVLTWTVKDLDTELGPNFAWWGVNEKFAGTNIVDIAIAPIPNAAWLLGSGLIGLRRRSRKQA